MATVIDTVERDGRILHVYDNGMERDATNGRMVKAPTAAIITTTEKANDLLRKRQELKRQRLLAGAAKHLETIGERRTPSDLDVVEAIGEKVMEKALDPKNAKQVDAARFILTEGGLSEIQQMQAQQNSDINSFIGAAVVDYIRRLSEPQEPVIDGLVRESDISRSNNLRIDAPDTSSPTDTDEDRDA